MGDKKTKKFTTLAAAAAHMATFAHYLENTSSAYTWAILVEHEGSFNVHERYNQPCYGEMRPYATGSDGNGPFEPDLLPEDARKVYKPTDLFAPFPQGKPLMLSVPLPGNYNTRNNNSWTELAETVLFNSEVSPWKNILKDVEIVYTENKIVTGLVFHNMEIEPTLAVNLFRKVKSSGYVDKSIYRIDKTLTLYEAYILSSLFTVYEGTIRFGGTHALGSDVDLSNVVNGTPNDYTKGTFAQRYAYNRPKQEYLFKGKKNFTTELANKFGLSDYNFRLPLSRSAEFVEIFRQMIADAKKE
jgi:hypothetical protein